MKDQLSIADIGIGLVRLAHVPEQYTDWRQWSLGPPSKNDFMHAWGSIALKALAGVVDGNVYKINAMYIEFDNSGAAVNPTPTINRAQGKSYYDALSSPRDYIRVPILATAQDTTDAGVYPLNNTLRWIAQTTGALGVHGLTFSDVAGSRVYGGALVCMRDPDDADQDVVMNRFYLPAANQLLKTVANQIGLVWDTSLT